MGYYYNNNYETVLNINNSEIEKFDDILYVFGKEKEIEIVNNQPITFNFSKFILVSNVGTILLEKEKEIIPPNGYNEEPSPLRLETYSPESEDLLEEFFLLESTYLSIKNSLYKIIINFKDGPITVLQRPVNSNDTSWMIIEHMFNFPNNVIKDVIDVDFYDLYGNVTHFKINFKVRQISLQKQGIELSLVNANMHNDKKVSYIFNNLNENQLLLARRDAIK